MYFKSNAIKRQSNLLIQVQNMKLKGMLESLILD